jgi:hypothetical protein
LSPHGVICLKVSLPQDAMERLLKWLDDIDDLMVVFRVQAPAVLITVLLATAFGAGMATLLLLAPPDLLAAP